MQNINKPQLNEHPDWAPVYISRMPDDSRVLDHLQTGMEQFLSLVEPLTDEQLLYSYDTGKWTIKEMIVHMIDVERVFSYRALGAARNDKSNLPGFDHNAYVPNSFANQRSKESLLVEYRALRTATTAFFVNLAPESLHIIGTAKDQPCTASAMVYMIAGHEDHHINLLKERYLSNF